jgi:hypothetical protein
MTTRRQAILDLTADLRAELGTINAEIAKIDAEMDTIRNPTVRLVRLSDRRWDLSARFEMINRQIERRVDAF